MPRHSAVYSRKVDPAVQAQALHQRAVSLLHTHHNLDGALAALNNAIALQPKAPNLLVDRGLLYRKMGRWSEAIADYTAAHALEERLAQEEALAAERARREGSRRGSPTRMGSGKNLARGSSKRFGEALGVPAPATPEPPAAAPRDDAPSRARPATEAPLGCGGGAAASAAGPASSVNSRSPRSGGPAAGGPSAGAAKAGAGAGEEPIGWGPPAAAYGPAFPEQDSLEKAMADSVPKVADTSEVEQGVLAGGLRSLSDGAMVRVLRAVETPPSSRSLEQSVVLSAALRAVPVLANLPEEARLRLCTTASYSEAEEGEVLQAGGAGGADGGADGGRGGRGRGDDGESESGLVIILSGGATVSKQMGGGGLASTTMRAGEHYGDIDLLHRSLRHATIRASEKVGLLHVPADEFRKVLRRNHLEEAAERAIFVAAVCSRGPPTP